MVEELEKYSDQLVNELKLEQKILKDENEVFTLDFGPSLVVKYRDLSPGLYVMAHISPLQEENREALLMQLMRMNLFGNGTKGAVIGYDEESKMLTFTQAVPYRLSYKDFRNTIEDFVNYVELWRNELKKIKERKKSFLLAK